MPSLRFGENERMNSLWGLWKFQMFEECKMLDVLVNGGYVHMLVMEWLINPNLAMEYLHDMSFHATK